MAGVAILLGPLGDTIAKKFLHGISQAALDAKFTAAIPAVVTGMESKHLSMTSAQPPVLIHDAIFRLWRKVIPSGDVADLIRDLQDPKIQVALSNKQFSNLTDLVTQTKDAILRQTF
jgi:hypothetical protein